LQKNWSDISPKNWFDILPKEIGLTFRQKNWSDILPKNCGRKQELPDFSWSKHTKTGKVYVPNDHKLQQTGINFTKWP
jgi:hypothetical protein